MPLKSRAFIQIGVLISLIFGLVQAHAGEEANEVQYEMCVQRKLNEEVSKLESLHQVCLTADGGTWDMGSVGNAHAQECDQRFNSEKARVMDETTLSCQKAFKTGCPSGQEWNSIIDQCSLTCAAGYSRNQWSGFCQSGCATGYARNESGACVLIEKTIGGDGDEIICEDDEVVVGNKCVKNDATQSCNYSGQTFSGGACRCPSGQVPDVTTMSCKTQQAADPPCTGGKTWSATKNQCVDPVVACTLPKKVVNGVCKDVGGGDTTTPETPETPADTEVADTTTEAQAQAMLDSDLSACSDRISSASQCCNNPLSCGVSGAKNSSQGRTCEQIAAVAKENTRIARESASVCTSKQATCRSSCNTKVAFYQSKLDNCNGCKAQAVYQSGVSAFNNYSTTCNSFSNQIAAFSSQNTNGNTSDAGGNNCSQLTKAEPASKEDGLEIPDTKETDVKEGNITAEEQDNKIKGLNTDVETAGGGTTENPGPKAGVAEPAKSKTLSDFNPKDLLNNLDAQMPSGKDGEAPTYNVVPNNSGGGVPGGGAGSANSASAAAKGKGVAGRSLDTDVFKGFMAGGASQDPGANHAANAQDPQYNNYGKMKDGKFRGPASANGMNHLIGVDLKRYLPGGAEDPYRRMAGFENVRSQINGPAVDMWNKVSEKMTERCQLDLLYKCK